MQVLALVDVPDPDDSPVDPEALAAAVQAALTEALPGLDAKYLPGSLSVGSNGPRVDLTGDLAQTSSPGHAVELDLSQVGYGVGPVIHGRHAAGTPGTPSGPAAGALLWGIGSRPHTGAGWTEHSTAAIHWVAEEPITPTGQGTGIRILVTPVGATWENRVLALQLGGDGVVDHMSVPTAQAFKSAANQVLENETYTPITFDAEAWDNNALHSTVSNTSRMVAPVNGKYRVTATVAFAGNLTGYRAINFRVNGSATNRYGSDARTPVNGATTVTTSAEIKLNAGDYVEVWAWQNSGAPLALLSETSAAQEGVCRFAMSYVSA